MIDNLQESLSTLSRREREVLVHLAEGHTYCKIARRMGLSVHTVDTYLRRIRGKTGATTRMHLAFLAMCAAQGNSPAPATVPKSRDLAAWSDTGTV
ncbi:helix-turn-helix transcriptional regulator [Streptomyces sp. NPDC048606]|uniref:response regulator transcription factor n=1 Tax=Streptomyces sp. NPDC048606 TaxID=3154726 RepID=UPI003418B0A8